MSDYTAPLSKNGNAFSSLKEIMSGPLDFMINETRLLGPIFRIKISNQYITVVSNDWVEKLLDREDELLVRKNLFETFQSETGVDIFSMQGDEHRDFKKASSLPFSRFVSGQFVKQMDLYNTSYLDQNQGDIDLMTLSRHVSMNAVMAMTSSLDLRDMMEDLIPFSETAMYVLTKQRPSIFLKSPSHMRRKKMIFDRLANAIEHHKEHKGDKLHLIDACLKQGMSDFVARSVCIYTLSGGNAYISKMVAFMLYEILRNETLKKEILLELTSIDYNGDNRAAQFRSLPVFRSTYYEALRFYPILAGIAFRAKKEIFLDDIYVPEGEIILLAPHLRHFDANFYRNPLVFDASRCLPDKGEHLNHYSYRPYGIGKRVCSAKGMNEILILNSVAHLLFNYKVFLKKITTKFNLKYNPLLGPDRKIDLTLTKRTADDLDFFNQLPEVVCPTPDFTDPFQSQEVDLIKYGQIVEKKKSDKIIKNGDKADSFWVLLKGEVEVKKDGDLLATLSRGKGFGELGLLSGSTRSADVFAKTDATLLRISEEGFNEIITKNNLDHDDIAYFCEQTYFKKVFEKSLKDSGDLEPSSLVEGGVFQDYKKGNTIFSEGDISDAFFLIVSGKVEVIKKNGASDGVVANLGVGDFFGEVGIINSKKRSAGIVAISNCKVLKIPKVQFEVLLSSSEGFHRNIVKIASDRILSQIS